MINFSCSTHLSEGFKGYHVDTLEAFCEVLKSTFNYSPFIYENNYRLEKNSKLEECNTIMLDFDDGLTIEEARELFKDYTHIIATTKSHQKEKNGYTCDRFRLILPLEENLDTTIEEYKQTMAFLILKYGNDKACKDIARFYYGYENSEVIVHYGKFFFDYDVVQKQAKLYFKIQKDKEKKANAIAAPVYKPTYNTDVPKIDYLRSILYTDKLLEVLKFYERFGAGGRNTYLFSCAKYLQDEGLSNEEVKNAILWVNNQGDGLKEKEIENTIFRSLKL